MLPVLPAAAGKNEGQIVAQMRVGIREVAAPENVRRVEQRLTAFVGPLQVRQQPVEGLEVLAVERVMLGQLVGIFPWWEMPW